MNKTIPAILGTFLAASVLQAEPVVTLEHVRGQAATVSFAGLDASTTNSLVFAWGGSDATGATPDAWPHRLFGGLVRPGDTTRTVTLPETVTGNLRAFLVAGVWDAPTDYVQDGMVNWWDGIDNAGTGTHNATATVWKDKAGDIDLYLTPNGAWNAAGNGLAANGLSATGRVATVAYQTIEVVFTRHHGACGNYVFSSGCCSAVGDPSSRLVINSGPTVQYTGTEHCPVSSVIPDSVFCGAATYEGNSIGAIYQEGVRPRRPVTFKESWSSSTKFVLIGGRLDSSYAWGPGEVFAIRLYDRVLTADEIAANHRLDAVRYLGVPRGGTVLAASAVQSCTKDVAVVSTGFDFAGKPVTATLAFRGVDSPCDLLMVWGDADAGTDPASWPNRKDLGVVEPDDETRVVELPSKWGDAVAHARFFLKGGVDAPAEYVTDGIMTWLDGIDNAGTGTHNPAATVWTDKAGTLDFALTNNAAWNAAGNALVCADVSAVAERTTVAYRTIEAVYRSTRADGRIVFISNFRLSSGNTGDCSRLLVDGGASEMTYFDGINKRPISMLSFPYDSRRIRCVAGVYDDQNQVASTFLEGSPVATAGYYNNWGCGDAGATIGGRGRSGSTYAWYGELHALRLYLTALTEEQLLANHRLDLVRFRGATRSAEVAASSADLTYAEGRAGGDESETTSEVVATKDGIRVDLRDGVRVVEWRKQLLPFTHSATCDRDFTDGYVRAGLINWWDGIDNAGIGEHDSSAATWKDKAGSLDLHLCGKGAWNAARNGLAVDGCSATGRVATAAYRTIETAFKIKNSSARILFSSGCPEGKNASGQPTRFVIFDHVENTDTMRGYFDGSKNTLYTLMQRDPTRMATLTGIYNAYSTVTGIYCDGVLDNGGKSRTNTWNPGSGKATIGNRTVDSNYNWFGEVYAIRLYDRELTSAEVANNHALDLLRFAGNGSSPASQFTARISLVQVTGAGDDVSTWSDEVPGTATTLVQGADAGEVTWSAKRGVWKVSLVLLFGPENYAFHTETAVFDLRDLGADATAIVIR